MNITWYGQACFKIETKVKNEEVSIITYPFDPDKTGLKLPRTLTADIVLKNNEDVKYPVLTKDGKKPFTIENAGEYEFKGIFIYAIPLPKHDDKSEHIFWIEAEDIVLVHPGPLNHVPGETELQKIEGLDILFTPVGGDGVLDDKKAAELASELEPRIVIPMMYKLPELKGKALGVEPFLKAVGGKPEQLPKLKIVHKDLPSDEMRIVVLEKA